MFLLILLHMSVSLKFWARNKCNKSPNGVTSLSVTDNFFHTTLIRLCNRYHETQQNFFLVLVIHNATTLLAAVVNLSFALLRPQHPSYAPLFLSSLGYFSAPSHHIHLVQQAQPNEHCSSYPAQLLLL